MTFLYNLLEHDLISSQEARTGQKPGPKKVVISRNMDLILQEVIDLLLRDYVRSWYKGLSRDQEALLSFLQLVFAVNLYVLRSILLSVLTWKFLTHKS